MGWDGMEMKQKKTVSYLHEVKYYVLIKEKLLDSVSIYPSPKRPVLWFISLTVPFPKEEWNFPALSQWS